MSFLRNLEIIINMVRNKNTLSEKILMAFTSFWAKLGISGAFIVGVFAFGRYYQESIMIRNYAPRQMQPTKAGNKRIELSN